MPELTEAPITEKDLSALVEPSVALPATKLRELLEYVGQLEDALKCTEFDLGRELEFSGFLRSCLIESSEELSQSSSKTSSFLRNWSMLLNNLLEQGSVGDEQVERFQEILNRIRTETAEVAPVAPAERAHTAEYTTIREDSFAVSESAAAAAATGETQDEVESSTRATASRED